MQNEGKTELIDRYLDKGMSDAEKHSFEQMMAEDPDLQWEVKARESTRNIARNQAEKESLQSLFHTFHKELDELDRGGQYGAAPGFETGQLTNQDIGTKKSRNWLYFALAAIVIIAAWLLYFYFTKNRR